MSKGSQTDTRGYMRLRDDFLSGFEWKRDRLTREEFREWARNRRNPPIHVGRHKWRPMRDGKPVPRPMVDAFSEYISDVLHLGRYPVSAIAAPCDPDQSPESDAPAREHYAWDLGWTRLFALITKDFVVQDEAYCQNEADIDLAARMVLQWVGEHTDKTVTGKDAIALAERVMRRTRDEYAQLLLKLWKVNEYAVLFTTLGEGPSLLRVGMTAMAPLTEEFYQRFRRGQAEDSDITAKDLSHTSKFLLHDAGVEDRNLDVRRAKASRSMTLARTIMYQLASLCPPLKGDTNLHLVSFAGTPESEKRLRSLSYRDTAGKTRLTGKTIMELGPPSLRTSRMEYPRDLGHYLAMMAILHIYQANIKGQHQLIED